ncbi:16S rRNA (cytosine(1402)-N(4))-methyltransferase RsmH [Acetobacteraceae bacterium KSS8]|uniref:Ribosomal RNA small subunit methyltransferase H n=1 Tax=Endosaccharibacter trunci TaxID=2812733 RepID=A0ABT1W373_9PROT|nr:16S rRNA (cytosine(1402)-N(4))-methyltransferase RsmH [Acetobacteraceae bacterium KSS8]
MNAMSVLSLADSGHAPVMLREIVEHLRPQSGGIYLDGTFGGGGYARAILGAADCTLYAIDRDPDAIARGRALAGALRAETGTAAGGDRLRMVEGGFGDMRALLEAEGVSALDGVVLDLGVSSFQIDQAERGFSFRADGPLDMRMSRSGPTAADLVNTLPEAELADVIYQYGEERLSRRIARAIVAARAEAPFETTLQLAGVIRRVVPADRSGIDPATRSFQALRIRVNDELGQIERGLEQAASMLRPGGRLVVVSFHSLEDRIVKRFMAEAAGRAPSPSRHDPRAQMRPDAPAGFRLVSGKALRPSDGETRHNPRARSAKLRTLERLSSAPMPPMSPGEAR